MGSDLLTSSLDRVLATLYHEEPDEVPCIWAFASKPMEDLFKRKGISLPPSDIITISDVIKFKVLKKSCRSYVLESPFGSLHLYDYYSRGYGCRKLLKPAIINVDDVERVPSPTLCEELIDLVEKYVRKYGEKFFLMVSHRGAFDSPWYYLRGFTKWLIDLVRNPDWVNKLIKIALEPQIEVTKELIKLGVHGVWVIGDLGNGKRLFISPQTYLKAIYPWHRKLVEEYHKLGAFVFLHSHGNLNPIIRLFEYIVKAGFDAINPLDTSEGMDLKYIKENYGDDITLIPQPSTIVLEKLKLKEICNYVRNQFKVCAPGGGFIYFAVIVYMSLNEALNYIKCVERYRRYPLK